MSIGVRHSEILLDFKSAVGWSLTPTSSPNRKMTRNHHGVDYTPESSPSPTRASGFAFDSIVLLPSPLERSPIAELINLRDDLSSGAGSLSSCSSNDDEGSATVCRHYLKGRCRHKKRCKFSHDVKVCPYCKTNLPDVEPVRTNHLAKCWKSFHELNNGASLD